MTVTADRESRVVIDNDGVFANPIDLDQYVESDTHIEVYADTTLLTLGVDYTVAGVGDNDGIEVTIEAPGLALAPDVWVVFHNPPLDQGADLSLGGQFGLGYEQALDALTRRVQSIADKLKRGISLAVNTPLDVATLEWPAPNPGRGVKWNADGTALIETNGDPDEAQDASLAAGEAAASAVEAANSAVAAAASAVAAAASAVDAALSASDADWGASIGVTIQAYDAFLTTLSGLGNGMLAKTGAGTAAARSIQPTAGQTSVSNGNGIAGDPTIGLANPLNGIAMNPTSIGATTRGPISGTSGNFSTTLTITGAADFNSTLDVTGRILGPNGTAVAPAFRFLSSASGMYRNSDGGPAFSLGGVTRGGFHSTGFTVSGTVDNALIDPNGAVVGGSISTVGAIASYQTSGVGIQLGRSADGNAANFIRAGVSRGTISVTAAGTAYNTTSDERLKNFVGAYDPHEAYRIIRADPVREFTWANDESKVFDIGWGAQTSYKVAARLATPGNNKRVSQKGFEPWAMDHSARIPYLWAAMSDVLDRIDAIEARLDKVLQ